jgi:hypothetical protein
MSRHERTDRPLRRARGTAPAAALPPRAWPGFGDAVAQLAREAHALLQLHRTVAELDPDDARTLARCRVTALRYLEALPPGVGPAGALRRLRATVRAWAPPTLRARARRSLDGRLQFWVGTVYGLRWRADVGERPAGGR